MPTSASDGSDQEFINPPTSLGLSFAIHDPPGAIILRPEPRMIIGRRDADFPDMKPDVDLEPYAAFAKGVSRRHATITQIGLTIYIQDRNSTNGTYLNGQRLFPGEPYTLAAGDQLGFGKLETRISLQHNREAHEQWARSHVSVILCQSRHPRITWSISKRTWLAIVLVAFDYGWRPALWPLPLGTPMPAQDAHALAWALEKALQDFTEWQYEWSVGRRTKWITVWRPVPQAIFDTDFLRKPPLKQPLRYLQEGGMDSMGKVRKAIAFCRLGQFTVVE